MIFQTKIMSKLPVTVVAAKATMKNLNIVKELAQGLNVNSISLWLKGILF